MKLANLFTCILIMFLAACSNSKSTPAADGTNIVTVIGAIHRGHKTSERYSLPVLERAIRNFEPDVIMVELPPDRFQQAVDNFEAYGEVCETRADDFPELIDVVFPIQDELGFKMVPAAAWSQKMADDRRGTLDRLKADHSRKADWAAYQAGIDRYNQLVSGKSDDPEFIHNDSYDAAVKARQEPYERLFGSDLGAGGWQQVNQVHLALINAGLDDLRGHGKRVLILFGAWHKYKILEDLEGRRDIELFNAQKLF